MTATPPNDLHVRYPAALLDLVADGTLSIHAAYVYMLLLTHINYKRGDAHVWPSRSNLAKRMNLKNAKSVDRHLDELMKVGLIERERRKTEKNGNESNRYTLAVVSWPKSRDADPSDPEVTRASDVKVTSLVTQKSPELNEPQLDQREPDQSTGQDSTTSGRCAPSGGDVAQGDAQKGEREHDEEDAKSSSRGSWWLEDRDTFRKIMGNRIVLEGVDEWRRGVFDVDDVYATLRIRKKRRIDRPGSLVADLLSKEDGRALENWLLREGIKTPDGVLG